MKKKYKNVVEMAEKLVIALQEEKLCQKKNELSYDYFVNKMIEGVSLQTLSKEFERNLVLTLIRRGYNTSPKLAEVLKTSKVNARQILMKRNIKLQKT